MKPLIITFETNLQVEFDYIGTYNLDELPTAGGVSGETHITVSGIDFNNTFDRDELIATVENILWPGIWKDINVNSVTDENIAYLVDSLLRRMDATKMADLNRTETTYGFQVTVRDMDGI